MEDYSVLPCVGRGTAPTIPTVTLVPPSLDWRMDTHTCRADGTRVHETTKYSSLHSVFRLFPVTESPISLHGSQELSCNGTERPSPKTRKVHKNFSVHPKSRGSGEIYAQTGPPSLYRVDGSTRRQLGYEVCSYSIRIRSTLDLIFVRLLKLKEVSTVDLSGM